MLFKSKVKYIQSLSQKKHRDAEGVFVAEGPKLINELLSASNVELVELFATSEWFQRESHRLSEKQNRFAVLIDSHQLERLSALATPNQAIAIFKKPEFKSPLNFASNIVVALDAVQDPGNLGTIVRCADWFGVKQVICSMDCADVFNPKAIQSTMGSVTRVQVLYTDLADELQRSASSNIIATTLDGSPISEIRSLTEGVIIIGNESKGVSDPLLKLTTRRITIPRNGEAESLNAAVAAAVVLSWVTS
jgi:RNA methyltransferase, TrmH family